MVSRSPNARAIPKQSNVWPQGLSAHIYRKIVQKPTVLPKDMVN